MDLVRNFIRAHLEELSARELRKKLRKIGCEELGIKGSHLKVRCPPNKQAVVPLHKGRDIKTRTLKNIEQNLGLRLENTEAEKYEKWQQYKQSHGRQDPADTEENQKVALFHQAAERLKSHMNLTHERKSIMWQSISRMNSNSLHYLKSYLSLGPHAWHDIKTMVLPGYV